MYLHYHLWVHFHYSSRILGLHSIPGNQIEMQILVPHTVPAESRVAILIKMLKILQIIQEQMRMEDREITSASQLGS